MPELGILLRDGTHSGATNRFRLTALNASIQIAKTPIQIPIPRQSPELFDIGIFRPSITISGIIKTVGVPGTTPFMEGETIDSEIYYIPYKNILEMISSGWLASESTTIELEIGDVGSGHDSTAGITPGAQTGSPWTTVGSPGASSNTQSGSGHTGGGIYRVAIQQARFDFNGGEEHFWNYTLQFVCEARSDLTFE